MTQELWQPSPEDIAAGVEGYVRYIGGVALLHEPESSFSRSICGQRSLETATAVDAIVDHAENMMYQGLQTVIMYANRPAVRTPLTLAEPWHAEALPRILGVIAAAYKNEETRLDTMSVAIRMLRPNPLFDHAMYKYLCRGRRYKIETSRLMDGIMPSDRFTIIDGRVLHTPRRGIRKVSPY